MYYPKLPRQLGSYFQSLKLSETFAIRAKYSPHTLQNKLPGNLNLIFSTVYLGYAF